MLILTLAKVNLLSTKANHAFLNNFRQEQTLYPLGPPLPFAIGIISSKGHENFRLRQIFLKYQPKLHLLTLKQELL